MAQQMRPLARLLFPEVNGFDGQTFGISIQYQPGVDTVLQPHTDASSATMNINLNLPHESFSGLKLTFFIAPMQCEKNFNPFWYGIDPPRHCSTNYTNHNYRQSH